MGTNEKAYRIATGPSIDRLVDSFKYLYSTVAKVSIRFGVTPEREPKTPIINPTQGAELLYVKNVRITTIQHRSKEYGSFNLRGVCDADVRIQDPELPIFYKTCDFIAHYDANTGKGIIAFE